MEIKTIINMKRILFLLLAFATLISGAQEIGITSEGLTEGFVTPDATVKDTVYKADSRLHFLTSTILPAIHKNLSEEIARQKVNGNVSFEAESALLYAEIEQAVKKYALNFIEVRDVAVNQEDIIAEFNELNKKIEELKTDPDIKYIEAIQEFKIIQERQLKLANYYNQLNKAWDYPVSYNINDTVTYNGKTYICIQAHTSQSGWTPSAVPALWNVKKEG